MTSLQVREILKQSVDILKPPPRLSLSQWADRKRVLSPEASAEPGRWYTERAEYQRGIMDAITDPTIEKVVIMTSSQVGKTEIILNTIGYFIEQDPSPIFVVLPTIEVAKDFSKTRLQPLLRDTPCLSEKFDFSSRNPDNTQLRKVFPGGYILLAGANSPASLAAKPVRILLMDEVDRFPFSAGAEGDPIMLAIKRTMTYWNRKIVMASTPTLKGLSRIEQEYEHSDRRKYYARCPYCEHYQVLYWKNVQWENGDPETAGYVCENCKTKWNEADRLKAVRFGEWRAEREKPKVAGFWLNALYSPWVKIPDLVREFFEVKKQPEKLKVFVNTVLAETWEDIGEVVETHELVARKEAYRAEVPDGVLVLTAGVDVQKDRLECVVWGWGKNDEAWVIDWKTFYGNVIEPAVWEQLDIYLSKDFTHEKGIVMKIACTAIDSGSYTQNVYNFVKGKSIRRIFAIKGASQKGLPIVYSVSRRNKAKVPVFLIGVDTAKELLFSRMQITEPGGAYIHFPMHLPEEFFMQLTAEKMITRFKKGVPTREWKKIRDRNEVLDCSVYAIAARYILDPNLQKLSKRIEKQSKEQETPQTQPPEQAINRIQRIKKQRQKKTSFVWRGLK